MNFGNIAIILGVITLVFFYPHITAYFYQPKLDINKPQKFKTNNGQAATLEGCSLNQNYVCTDYDKNIMPLWRACPYQMPGNWRWDRHFDWLGNPTHCTHPADGTRGNGTDLKMGPDYHLVAQMNK